MNFKKLGLIFFCGFFILICKTEAEKPETSSSRGEAGGLLLLFHHWPKKKEREIIIQYMEQKGLKKTRELGLLKIWIFSWKEASMKSFIEAADICVNKPKVPSLKFCSPHYAVFPKRTMPWDNLTASPDYAALPKRTETISQDNLTVAPNDAVPSKRAETISWDNLTTAPDYTVPPKRTAMPWDNLTVAPDDAIPSKRAETMPWDNLTTSPDYTLLPKRKTDGSSFKLARDHDNGFSDIPSGKTADGNIQKSKALSKCKIVEKISAPNIKCQRGASGICSDKRESNNKTLAGLTWAQDMIGADLIKEELKKKKPKKKNLVSIFDLTEEPKLSPRQTHGQSVKGLIAGEHDQAVLPPHDVSLVEAGKAYENKGHIRSYGLLATNDLLEAVEKNCRRASHKHSFRECRQNTLPSYINYSMSLTGASDTHRKANRLQKLLDSPPKDKKDYQTRFSDLNKREKVKYETALALINHPRRKAIIENMKNMPDDLTMTGAFKRLSSQNGSIIITASGNDHPLPIFEGEIKASKNFDAILVGSLDPDGEKSPFSQEHEELAIMAPSGYDIYSHNGQHIKRFSGTSGATPLVTASLAGFEWLSDYHPTAEEAKILLRKTAIPTKYSSNRPRRNGTGMINSYKLGMVGKRLKTLCGENKACFKQRIRDPAVYDFPKDPDLKKDVESAFPECNRSCGGQVDNSCANKAKTFKKLRQAIFLDPSDKKNWAYLSCIYNSNGFQDASQAALKSYKASFAPQAQHPKACEKNEDCLVAPDCRGGGWTALPKTEEEIYYALKCKKTMCGERCGCGSSVTKKQGGNILTYSGQCQKSQCALDIQTDPSFQTLPTDINEGDDVPSLLKPPGSRGKGKR